MYFNRKKQHFPILLIVCTWDQPCYIGSAFLTILFNEDFSILYIYFIQLAKYLIEYSKIRINVIKTNNEKIFDILNNVSF